MAENPRSSPRDYMPVARVLIAHREELADAAHADREQDVAAADQANAAARDSMRVVEETTADLRAAGIDPQTVAPRLSARSLAWNLAVAGAITRRIPDDRKCPHATPRAGRPLLAMLTSRWLVCGDCGPRMIQSQDIGEDDGRCDVCDRPASQYSEFMGGIVGVRVTGNICSLCRYWLDGLERGA